MSCDVVGCGVLAGVLGSVGGLSESSGTEDGSFDGVGVSAVSLFVEPDVSIVDLLPLCDRCVVRGLAERASLDDGACEGDGTPCDQERDKLTPDAGGSVIDENLCAWLHVTVAHVHMACCECGLIGNPRFGRDEIGLCFLPDETRVEGDTGDGERDTDEFDLTVTGVQFPAGDDRSGLCELGEIDESVAVLDRAHDVLRSGDVSVLSHDWCPLRCAYGNERGWRWNGRSGNPKSRT